MSRTRAAGLYAVCAAAGSVLFAPLLALSYFATDSGADELQAGTVAAWAEPARDLADGLLTWASPDRVYATYVQVFALLFPAVLICARVTRARRPAPHDRVERWGWRIALTGYGLACAGLAIGFLLLFGRAAGDAGLNAVYLALLVPGMLLSALGSTVLGVALLRTGYRPRATAWLLALAFPLLAAGSGLLGHNSLGLVPLFVAWGLTGLRLWREPLRRAAPQPATGAGALQP
jgi:hypothetical protein